jgi:hypothetical protein
MLAFFDIDAETRRLIAKHAIRSGRGIGEIAEEALTVWLDAHPLPSKTDDINLTPLQLLERQYNDETRT